MNVKKSGIGQLVGKDNCSSDFFEGYTVFFLFKFNCGIILLFDSVYILSFTKGGHLLVLKNYEVSS
jgi:hypothetical protein